MKKLFSKIETKIDNTVKEPNSYIGKAFTVGRMTVTVEDVLAEGKIMSKVSVFFCLKSAYHVSFYFTQVKVTILSFPQA